jgi:hypothetical protein
MIKELELKAYKSVFNIKVRTSSTPTTSARNKQHLRYSAPIIS